MRTFDFIIVGAGITGSALAYELAKLKYEILLLDKDPHLANATYYSYGGLAYWSGLDRATQEIFQEGIEIHRHLATELGADTEFEEVNLLLTVPHDRDLKSTAKDYQKFSSQPDILTREETVKLEPLIDKEAISGALRINHARVHPHKVNLAYQNALIKLGGTIEFAEVKMLLKDSRDNRRIIGVNTNKNNYYGKKTIVCAGGLSRSLLASIDPKIPLYFTRAVAIKTIPSRLKLNSIVMPAIQQRFSLEASANNLGSQAWNEAKSKSIASILDAGAVQFQDGSFCLGQISELNTNPHAKIDLKTSEREIRRSIAKILPSLADLTGTCHDCLIAFAENSLPVAAKISGYEGIYSFSGFTSTMIFAPPMARRFARTLC
jgi:glycine/D-amino acid oxidase-like deaminating enzyme